MKRFGLALGFVVAFASCTQRVDCADSACDAGADVPPRSDALDALDAHDSGPRDVLVADWSDPAKLGCTADSQCGSGGFCLTGFAGGVCSRQCTSDRACGSDGICDARRGFCIPACEPGSGSCDQYGGACEPIDLAAGRYGCRPSCYVGESPQHPSCVSPLVCDLYSGDCTSTPAVGADNGAACSTDSDCRGGHCMTELDASGRATGWIGGYCLSYGRATDVTQGETVPQSNCPAGSGAVPIHGEQPGDSAPCFRTCDATTDCRAGYRCDHLVASMGGGPFFSNGVCMPIDCMLAEMNCPAGYHCETDASDAALPSGLCSPDSETDAGATDTGTTDTGTTDTGTTDTGTTDTGTTDTGTTDTDAMATDTDASATDTSAD